MKILIVHHGSPKSEGGPTSGSALRAHQFAVGLLSAGYTVKSITRANDAQGGYVDSQDLLQRAKDFDPDAIICVQLDEALTLSKLDKPLVVDLYAMRLLEAQFSGHIDETVIACLSALSVGDAFLVSNERQKWAWLGVMSMAGIDVRNDPTLLTPLSANPVAPVAKHSAFTVVGGGCWWPWQSPWQSMKAMLDEMDKQDFGQLHWYGSGDYDPPFTHPRLSLKGWLSHDEFLLALSKCHVAFDAYELHPERELATSFRQMDYLSAGLPIATVAGVPLARELQNAGWLTDDWAGLVKHWKNDQSDLKRKSENARNVALNYTVTQTLTPLLTWLKQPERRKVITSKLFELALNQSAAADAAKENERLNEHILSLNDDIEKKNQEVQRAQSQIDHLTTAIDHLSRAVDEVAGFKREATAILGARIESQASNAENLSRENSILRADIEKKSAELDAMDQLRQRLENDIQKLRQEVLKAKNGKRRFFSQPS